MIYMYMPKNTKRKQRLNKIFAIYVILSIYTKLPIISKFIIPDTIFGIYWLLLHIFIFTKSIKTCP